MVDCRRRPHHGRSGMSSGTRTQRRSRARAKLAITEDGSSMISFGEAGVLSRLDAPDAELHQHSAAIMSHYRAWVRKRGGDAASDLKRLIDLGEPRAQAMANIAATTPGGLLA